MKYLFLSLVFILIPLTLTSCYYATQGHYLLKYTYSAKKIDKLLETTTISPSTRSFLESVSEIRTFIKEHVHLVSNKNYKSYKELDQDYLVLVVQASPTTKIMPYMWTYPFFGKLPYRGFYRKEDAIKEAKKIQAKGYETYVRKVRAFSTLRILPDPLYSFMKDYKIGDLVELIAHEQTHATLWVPRQSGFNEQLATFVGRESAREYLIQKYGKNSQEYIQYIDQKIDREQLSVFFNEVKDALNVVYNDETLDTETKLKKRKDVLEAQYQKFVSTYDKKYLLNSYKGFDVRKLNNAFFALISVYEENLDVFAESFTRCDKSLIRFMDEVKPVKKLKYRKKPLEFVKNICTQ